MNIEPLYELKERLHVSAVAGISLMPDDFRLKRAIEQMEPLSKAAPVFQKLYQGALNILEVPAEKRADALLDELALLDAVLVTQAAAGIEGELLPINEGLCETVHTDTPYSKAAPILEALTTSGSGHYSYITQLHEESPESFRDFRLKEALVNGLGASYSELAETVEQWLSKEDASFLPFLKKGFQPDGKKEMVRRVHVIEQIARAAENDWYIAMLDTAQKEVREALIYALRHDVTNQELLSGLAKTEKGKGKKAAIWALTRMEKSGISDFFRGQLKKNADSVWRERYFSLSTNDELSDLLADEINKELDILENQVKSGNYLLSAKECEKVNFMFDAMSGKSTDKIIEVYKRLAAIKVFQDLKEAESVRKGKSGEEHYNPVRFWDSQSIGFYYSNLHAEPFSQDYVANLLSDSILIKKDEKLYALADELYREYQEPFLKPALIAALLTRDGKEVFSEFSHYLVQKGEKESEEKKAGRLTIMNTFSMLHYDTVSESYVFTENFFDAYSEKPFKIEVKIFENLDSEWIVLLTDNKIKKDGTFKSYCYSNYYSLLSNGQGKTWDGVLEGLICPSDSRNCELLGKYFRSRALYSKRNSNANIGYYEAMKKCHYRLETGSIIEHIKTVNGINNFWTFDRMIKTAPMEDEDKREELKKIKELVEKKEIRIEGWSEDRYVRILSEL